MERLEDDGDMGLFFLSLNGVFKLEDSEIEFYLGFVFRFFHIGFKEFGDYFAASFHEGFLCEVVFCAAQFGYGVAEFAHFGIGLDDGDSSLCGLWAVKDGS